MKDLALFSFQQRPGARLWMRRGLEWTSSAKEWLEEGENLLEASVCGPLDGGRGGVQRVDCGGRPGVWRRNLHGGLLGPVLGPRFLTPRRLQDEILLSETLRVSGILTPKVLLAYAGRRSGAWNHHLVTAEVPHCQTVFDARQDPAALAAGQALLDRLFDFGLWAPDLHPANLLWQAQEERCWILDLADARLLGRPLDRLERHARRRRFDRYFRKHSKGTSTPASG